jgi:hypothetical protein
MNYTALQTILQIIETAAATAQPFLAGVPEGAAIDAAAEALAAIAQQAIGAYQLVAGKPMDLSTLQPITPVE